MSSCSTHSLTVSITYAVSFVGSSSFNLSKSPADRNGFSVTGPTPGLISIPNPTACTGTIISEYKIAASTPYLRTGCNVISADRAGSLIASKMLPSFLNARYSGSERPACRMNHTGICSGCSQRQAWRKGELDRSMEVTPSQ